MQVKKQLSEVDMEWTGSKLGKKYTEAILLSPYFSLYAEYTVWNVDNSQAEIKTARRNINLRCAYGTTPMTKSEEELKSLLMMM